MQDAIEALAWRRDARPRNLGGSGRTYPVKGAYGWGRSNIAFFASSDNGVTWAPASPPEKQINLQMGLWTATHSRSASTEMETYFLPRKGEFGSHQASAAE